MKLETIPPDSFQVITFSLVNESNKKKEHYAVPIEQVREIRNFTEITTVPKAKEYVKGIMNLRGLIIPVIDIKKRLGFGEVDDLNKIKYKIIIADVRDSIYGLLVDKVEHVIHISPKDIEPIPSDSFESHHYIKGIVKIQGLLVVLLDIIALFEDPQENSNEIIESQIDIHTNNESSEKNLKPDEIDDDVPEELKEVFREDAKINSSLEESV
ncbi:MAG TPA: chemotaxis protein CheW [Nitrosopumilaceae archaeon]